ncbi:MAG: DUF262 domain-containing protein [Hyphomicrobiales bacterium]
MRDCLSIKPFYIQTVYDQYKLEGKYQVNRKYQRKLVWTIDEKRQFIDSITKKYPIPLILVALQDDKFEIIDGMQRLNAIFSFIEGEFGLYSNSDGEECFFDLATMPTTNELVDDQKIRQRKPVLDRSLCREIANYELPFSVASFNDKSKIEDIFKRINSNGRHLSHHELRQAGALGKFPDLVRTLSAKIRRDSSPCDKLSLAQMKEISLSNKKLSYGINLFEVFWVKQNIIPIYNMRLSRDEEVVAYILVYIILGHSINPSKSNLDNFYKFSPKNSDDRRLSTLIENQITKIGVDSIDKSFNKVFNELERLLKETDKSFQELVFNDKPVGLVRSFQVIYLAFYELLVREKMKITDYNRLLNSLEGIGGLYLSDIDSNKWCGKFRDQKIKAISGVIRGNFEQNDCPEDPSLNSWVVQFENLLRQSKIEQPTFDFKIGLCRLDNKADFLKKTFDKVIKTLTSMANIGPQRKGYVLIGVADNDEDAEKFTEIYKKSYSTYQNHKITGVDEEAKRSFNELSTYFERLRNLVEKQPIESYTKEYILQNMKLINYYDKSILVFEIMSTKEPLLYDEKYFVRKLSSVIEVRPAEFGDLYEKFKQI